MRKILMSERGEFDTRSKKNFFRGVAVKMVARIIQASRIKQLEEEHVVISTDFNQLKPKVHREA